MKTEDFTRKLEAGLNVYFQCQRLLSCFPDDENETNVKYRVARASNGNKWLDTMYYEDLQKSNPEKFKRMQAIIQHSIEVQRRQMFGRFYWFKIPPYNPVTEYKKTKSLVWMVGSVENVVEKI